MVRRADALPGRVLEDGEGLGEGGAVVAQRSEEGGIAGFDGGVCARSHGRHAMIMHPGCPDQPGKASRSLAGVTDGGSLASEFPFAVPAIPASAGAMIFDRKGRLLILNPTYKSGWTIPGGVMEADGETPWEACRREVREECGLEVHGGRLACVDFRRQRPGRPGGIRFLFDCGALDDASLHGIVLQKEEISEYRIVRFADALILLRGPIRRRVGAARTASTVAYLEDGRPVPGIGR
jgi:8-oxo-dGTP diphosphatase